MKPSDYVEVLGLACFVAACVIAAAAATGNALWPAAAGTGSAFPALLFFAYGVDDPEVVNGMRRVLDPIRAHHKARKAARKQARADRRTAKAAAAV